MKSAIKFLLFASVISSGVFGQGKTENLKKQQKKLERKISNTRSLLKKVTSTREESLSELQLINNQIQSRENQSRVYPKLPRPSAKNKSSFSNSPKLQRLR